MRSEVVLNTREVGNGYLNNDLKTIFY